MSMKKNKEEKKNSTKNVRNGLISVICLSLLFLLMGILMIVNPDRQSATYSMVTGLVILVWGLILVASYFIRKMYRNLSNYDFTIGTMMVIAALIIMIKSELLGSYMMTILGGLSILETVIILQHAIQIKLLKGRTWGIVLACAVIIGILAIGITTDFKTFFTTYDTFFSVCLIVIGVLGLLSTIFAGIRTRQYRKEQDHPEHAKTVKGEAALESNVPIDDEVPASNIFDEHEVEIETADEDEE